MVRSLCRSRSRIFLSYGLSQVELLVVVCIAGLLAAIAAPALTNVITQYRMTVSSNALMSAFALARQSAIAKNQVVTICAGNPEAGCHADWSIGEWLIFNDPNQNGKQDTNEALIHSGSAKLDQAIRILSNRPMQAPVMFQPIGHAEQPNGAFAAGTLRLCTGSRRPVPGIDLILSKSGSMRAQNHGTSGNCTTP